MGKQVQILAMGKLSSLMLNDEEVPKCKKCGQALIYNNKTYIHTLDVFESFFSCENNDCKRENNICLEKLRIQNMRDEVIRLGTEMDINPNSAMKIMHIPPKYHTVTFDTFKGGNKYVTSLKRYTEKPIESIYLYGKCGSGKTHLAVSVMRELYKNRKDIFQDVIFQSVPELLLEIRQTFRNNSEDTEADIIERYSSYKHLILDDFGAEKSSEFTIASLYLIINRRLNNNLSTLVTSNLTINEVEEQINARLASRFAEYKYYFINMPDYRKSSR